jgi:hypothetical protein
MCVEWNNECATLVMNNNNMILWCMNAQCCNFQKQWTKVEMQIGLKLLPMSIHFTCCVMCICFNFLNCDFGLWIEKFVVHTKWFCCLQFAFLKGSWNLKTLVTFLCVLFSPKVHENRRVQQHAKFVFCWNFNCHLPNLLGDNPWVFLKSDKLALACVILELLFTMLKLLYMCCGC